MNDRRAKIKCRKPEEMVGKKRNRNNCGWNAGFLLELVHNIFKKREQLNPVVEGYGKQRGQGNIQLLLNNLQRRQLKINKLPDFPYS